MGIREWLWPLTYALKYPRVITKVVRITKIVKVPVQMQSNKPTEKVITTITQKTIVTNNTTKEITVIKEPPKIKKYKGFRIT